MVADLAKQFSDDTDITNNHIAFLLNKYRTYLLKQKYNNKAQEVPISNYQTVCAKMSNTETSSLGNCCMNSCYGPSKDFKILRSENTVTYPLSFSDTKASLIRCAGKFTISVDEHNDIGQTSQEDEEFCNYINELIGQEAITIYDSVPKTLEDYYLTTCAEDVKTIIDMVYEKFPKYYTLSVYQAESPFAQECNPDAVYSATTHYYGNVNIVPRERFGYVGIGKYSGKIIYGTIGTDGHLYIKAKDDISIYNTAFVTSIFENPDKAYEQSSCTYTYEDEQHVIHTITCPNPENGCDPWDNEFPLEDALQAPLIQLVLKDILGAAYRPADTINNGRDDLSNTEAYIRKNMKQQYVAQQEPQTIE